MPALLALTVWAVYVADRLLDARAALPLTNLHRLRDRHFFHWRHRRILLPLAIAAAAAAAGIVFTLMPPINRERNSILAAASLVYFTRVHTGRKLSPHLPSSSRKNSSSACSSPPDAPCPPSRVSPPTLPAPTASAALDPVAFFTLLAWLNCHAIDRWEAHQHSATRPHPSPRGAPRPRWPPVAALLLNTQPRSAALLAAGSAAALLLALLDRLRARLTPIALRAAADLVLLTPLLLIPCATALQMNPPPNFNPPRPPLSLDGVLHLRPLALANSLCLPPRTSHRRQRPYPRRWRRPLHRPPAPRRPRLHIDAVDASSAMLPALLRRAGPNASRVRIYHADARTFHPPNPPYDLIVTHFFLDCLSTAEIQSLAATLRAAAAPHALWLVSEFAVPPTLFGRLVARPLVWFLYRAFGLLTGLTLRQLPDHRTALSQSGFTLRNSRPRSAAFSSANSGPRPPIRPATTPANCYKSC